MGGYSVVSTGSAYFVIKLFNLQVHQALMLLLGSVFVPPLAMLRLACVML